jgi:hypothetical protein
VRILIVALCLVHAATIAAAQEQDARALFAEGRYPAAAAAFERKWRAAKHEVDAVNAVVAWRLAGRYARARVLLAKLVDRGRPDGDLGAHVDALEQKLAVLTGTVTFTHAPSTAAIVKIDGDPPERIGRAIIVDVGEHEITVDQERCQRWRRAITVHPGEQLSLSVEATCDDRGSLHVHLIGDPHGAIHIDGKLARAVNGDVDVPLAPGPHRLRVTASRRDVDDRSIEIRSARLTAIDVRYPWRARPFAWVFGFDTTTFFAGDSSQMLAMGVLIGIEGRRFRALLEGPASTCAGTEFGFVPTKTGGHPEESLILAWRPWLRPLLRGTARGWHVTFDADPLTARLSYFDVNFPLGLLARLEVRAQAVQLGSISLTADRGRWHAELVLWPFGVWHYIYPAALYGLPPVVDRTTWTAAASVLVGFAF